MYIYWRDKFLGFWYNAIGDLSLMAFEFMSESFRIGKPFHISCFDARKKRKAGRKRRNICIFYICLL